MAVFTSLSVPQATAQGDQLLPQFQPISVEDRVKHFSGGRKGFNQPASPEEFSLEIQQVTQQQQQFQGVQPRKLQTQIRKQQQQFQPQQFIQNQQQFQPQQFIQNQQPLQQQLQQKQFQPSGTQSVQQFPQTQQPQSFPTQRVQVPQQQQFQEFPPGAQVPTNLAIETPEHVRTFQQQQSFRGQSKPSLTVFAETPSAAPSPSTLPSPVQFRKPSTTQFQQLRQNTNSQANQFQQQPGQFQQQPNQFQQNSNKFQQQPTFQQPSQQPFTAFNQNQPIVSNNQQQPFPQQFAAQSFQSERPRSSQQFIPSRPLGVFDQIKTAINTGRRFSPQNNQFIQNQQPFKQPLSPQTTTQQPPPKFVAITAVPGNSSEEIKTKETSEKEHTKEEKKEPPVLVDLIKKVVVQTIAGKDLIKDEDKIEKAAIIEELNDILGLLSETSQDKIIERPETSLIKIQEKLLGLSDISEEETNRSEDLTDLLKLSAKSSKKKIKNKTKHSLSTLQEKLHRLSIGENDSKDSELLFLKKNKKKSSLNEVIDTAVEEIKSAEEDDDDLSAVRKALTTLLGKKPAEDSKLSPEVFSAVLKLDDFLKQEEKQKTKKINEVESLVDTALGFIDGAVTLREHAEKRLIDREPVFDYDDYYEEILETLDLTPSELKALIKSKAK